MIIDEMFDSDPEKYITRAIVCEMVCQFDERNFNPILPFSWQDCVDAYNYMIARFGYYGYVELRDVYRIQIGARSYHNPSDSNN